MIHVHYLCLYPLPPPPPQSMNRREIIPRLLVCAETNSSYLCIKGVKSSIVSPWETIEARRRSRRQQFFRGLYLTPEFTLNFPPPADLN